MTVSIITIETPSLGDRTYLAHDGQVAVVVDPQRDIDRVLAAADEAGVQITHVVETHLHNDYVSGGRDLAALTGATHVTGAGAERRTPPTPSTVMTRWGSSGSACATTTSSTSPP